jgi:sugar O-acyltransferase (sialic acid O-acetyltransferase NeuD family)
VPLSPPQVVLYGASGYAVALRDLIDGWEPQPLATVVAYIDDFRGDDGEAIDGVPIVSFGTWRASLRDIPIFVIIGSPSARRTLVERVSGADGRFASFYRVASPIARDVVVGEGTMILPYATIGASTVLGRHVHVMPLVSIDAECTIGDFTTLCPSSTVYGRVVVEDGVFIGVGARIVNESDEPLTVGAGAMISAGAIVTRSVGAGQKLAGNPAQELRSLATGRRT